MISNCGLGRYATSEYDVVLAGNPRGARYGQVLIYCHAANDATGTELLAIPQRAALLEALVNSGLTVIAPQLGGANTWGNSVSQARMNSAYDYATGLFPGITKVALLAQSMGAVVGLVWASNNLDKVSAVVGVLPVVDLDFTYTLPAFAPHINSAYGGAYNPAGNGLGRNPIKLAKAGAFNSLKIQLWAAREDTAAPPGLASEFSAVAAMTELIFVEGLHTEDAVGLVRPDEVLAFL